MVHIRVTIPANSLPWPYNSGYLTCSYNNDGYQYFDWRLLEEYQYWVATVRVTYGADNTVLYNKRYGYLHSNDPHGVNVYPTGENCASTSEIVSGYCPQFPIQLKEGVTNTIYVNLAFQHTIM